MSLAFIPVLGTSPGPQSINQRSGQSVVTPVIKRVFPRHTVADGIRRKVIHILYYFELSLTWHIFNVFYRSTWTDGTNAWADGHGFLHKIAKISMLLLLVTWTSNRSKKKTLQDIAICNKPFCPFCAYSNYIFLAYGPKYIIPKSDGSSAE